MSNLLKLIVSIVICQAAGLVGLFVPNGSDSAWYMALIKPSFNPPGWIFGPVWITLYLLMGFALFLVWKEGLKNKTVKSAFTIFIIQLILNALWSPVFFGLQSIEGGLGIIIILLILIAITIQKFLKVSRLAGYLLIPYLLWVTFATALNFAIWQLNK